MKRSIAFIASCFLSFSLLFSHEDTSKSAPSEKVVIVGSGIIGAVESYYAYLDAREKGKNVSIVVYDKNSPFSEQKTSSNAAFNIFPSLTPDEILCVVPLGKELIEKLALLFSQPGGIRVDDVPGVNDSPSAMHFKEAVQLYGNDPNHEDRVNNLLLLGKMSMQLWQDLYDQADVELQEIMRSSNFNPCHAPTQKTPILHDGYRIDLIYEVANAENRAKGMQATYQQLGYSECKLLSPSEVEALDPSLADFCKAHSKLDRNKVLVWNDDASAIWRPGGCISTPVFLPKFFAYLKKVMGTYVDASGNVQDRFRLEFNKEVTGVELDASSSQIIGIKFAGGSSEESDPAQTFYVFCPGEAVGTLNKLGFQEPAFAGFAGPALRLMIPVSPEQAEKYKSFNHCMEVHKVGVVLAWQARFKDNNLIIGVAGTKAFYGDVSPSCMQDFAMNRHLLQLNMINDVLPEMVSIAAGYDTKGKQLLPGHLDRLESKGVLKRWVGRRAVAYDGFPTLGALYRDGHKVMNARCTTHLGSGGVSFAPAAVQMSRRSAQVDDAFTAKILQYADSRRKPVVQ